MPMCPLCKSEDNREFHEDKKRKYNHCSSCDLIFVPSEFYLDAEEEKSRYDLHQNDPTDEKYRAFLNKLFEPLNKLIMPNSLGLDFGSGPGPTLSLMFEEAGHNMNIYDPFYADDKAALEKEYDFITATEVLEHLHDPAKELDLLFKLLKPGGLLGIMTQPVISEEAFKTWHYKDDDTHVCFFSEESFKWISEKYNADIKHHDNSVVIFSKN